MLPHGEAGRRVRPPHCLAVSKSRHCAAGRAASTRLRHPHPAHRHPRRWLLLPLRQPDCGSVRSGPGGRRHLHRRAAAAGGLGAGHSRRRPSRVLRGALFSRAFDAFPRFWCSGCKPAYPQWSLRHTTSLRVAFPPPLTHNQVELGYVGPSVDLTQRVNVRHFRQVRTATYHRRPPCPPGPPLPPHAWSVRCCPRCSPASPCVGVGACKLHVCIGGEVPARFLTGGALT